MQLPLIPKPMKTRLAGALSYSLRGDGVSKVSRARATRCPEKQALPAAARLKMFRF